MDSGSDILGGVDESYTDEAKRVLDALVNENHKLSRADKDSHLIGQEKFNESDQEACISPQLQLIERVAAKIPGIR